MKRYMIFLLIFILLISIGCQTINGKSPLEKVLVFKGENAGYASLNSKDGSLLVNYSDLKGNKGIYWYKDKKIINRIPNVMDGSVSPNGDYYSFYNKSENMLYIFKENGQLMNKFNIEGFTSGSTWSYDSKYIYWDEYGEKYIYRIDIFTGTKELILESKRIYNSPVAINNPDILYLLERISPNDSDSDSNIVKYDLKNNKIEKVILPPIKDLFIFDSYSISPNGKIAVFPDEHSGNMYVIDIMKNKIIDTIMMPDPSHPQKYSWESDSSYFIFNVTGQEIDKYTIPKH